MKWIIAYEIGSVVLAYQKRLVGVEMNILSVVYILFLLLILVIMGFFVLLLLEIEREILDKIEAFFIIIIVFFIPPPYSDRSYWASGGRYQPGNDYCCCLYLSTHFPHISPNYYLDFK